MKPFGGVKIRFPANTSFRGVGRRLFVFLFRGRNDFRLGNDDRIDSLYLERRGVPLEGECILISRFRRYSPRVPAGEASAILEVALLDNFAFGVGDRELRLRRPWPLTIIWRPARPIGACNVSIENMTCAGLDKDVPDLVLNGRAILQMAVAA